MSEQHIGDELAPCPFCGGASHVDDRTSDEDWAQRFVIMCRECCGSSGWYGTEAEAITAWNTRPTQAGDELARELEAWMLLNPQWCSAKREMFDRILSALRPADNVLRDRFLSELDAHGVALGKPPLNDDERAVIVELFDRAALKDSPPATDNVLREALEKAAKWFDDYERLHREKRTADGALKADTNAERAEYLRAALKASPTTEPNPEGMQVAERVREAAAKVAETAAKDAVLSFSRIGEGNRLNAARVVGIETSDAIRALDLSTLTSASNLSLTIEEEPHK